METVRWFRAMFFTYTFNVDHRPKFNYSFSRKVLKSVVSQPLALQTLSFIPTNFTRPGLMPFYFPYREADTTCIVLHCSLVYNGIEASTSVRARWFC